MAQEKWGLAPTRNPSRLIKERFDEFQFNFNRRGEDNA